MLHGDQVADAKLKAMDRAELILFEREDKRARLSYKPGYQIYSIVFNGKEWHTTQDANSAASAWELVNTMCM